MSILFYCPWSNQKEWLKEIKKKFINQKVVTLKDEINFSKIKYAIIWNLPDKIYKKLINIELLFSLGAGVDHILKLPSYNNVPIVRLKDPMMAQRMSNHVLSQILYYQLDLKTYIGNQNKRQWRESSKPLFNSKLLVGILGTGFLGSIIGKNLMSLGYRVQGYKNSKSKGKEIFPIFYKKKDLKKFIKTSNIIISILPATLNTFNFINCNFLKLMKKKSLLINVGRGTSVNEEDLIRHLKYNRHFQASLDVFQNEPLPKNHPFWRLPNVIITPHIASVTAINSAVEIIFKQYKKFKYNKIFKSDVDLKKGY